MKKYLTYILFGIIILLAVVTRFYKLGEIPKGFYVDEAGQGYSAYSLLKTGKDEFGKSFPIVFRSLTDFKTPIYTYLIVPLIPVFGLNTYTVRFPSAVFGILGIILTYLLIKELSNNKWLPVLSALLLAISPWHILFSRTDFECTVSLTLLLGGVLLFYKSIKKPYLLVFSAILMAVSLPAYQAERIIVPLVVIALFIRHKNILLGKRHVFYFLLALGLAFLITLPTLSIMFTPGFVARATGLNIFSHLKQMPDGFIASYRGILSPIINGSWFLSVREFLALYFSYLSPRYMFMLGDYGVRSSFPELSTFFLWQFPFYVYGLWILFSKKNLGELKFLTILMLVISPIPAAVTRDPYTTIRALPLVIPQIIIISLGITNLLSGFKKNYQLIIFYLLFMFIILYSLFKLYSSVAILNEYYRPKAWDWGWEDVVSEIQKLHTNLPIIIDNGRSDPDLQIAFFLKYPPINYQKENFEVPLDQYYTNLHRNPVKHIGNVTTRAINWKNDLIVDQYLVGDELGISLQQIDEHNLTLIDQINYPDGTPAFRIVKTNPQWERAQRAKQK